MVRVRLPLLLATGLLALVAAGTAWQLRGSETAVEPDSAALPLPPVPPRVAEGPDYEQCMAMLTSDPEGANNFADAWVATGGGEGATHCLALAKVALGNVAAGAEMLESLAGSSTAPDVARAAVYAQAAQAWLMAGEGSRALGAATLALSLSDDDPDLLIGHSVAAATVGRYDNAVEDLTRALELDPKRPDALVLRAAAYRHTGHLQQAADDAERALSQDPDDPEAYLERGILRERGGDRHGARSDWLEAKTLSPDTPTSDLAEQNLALLEAGPDQR